jgi:putative flippase GtrA
MLILIPAYEPNNNLVLLLEHIRSANSSQCVVIVDDGSGPAYQSVFHAARTLGADVITQEVNRGKGSALRSGFAHAMQQYAGEVVVCVDCDGQHTYDDAARVGREVARRGNAMVLGARDFSTRVPAKSRVGNVATRHLFRLGTGTRLQDTQTGLRGYPSALLPWLCTVSGDRFDYELRVLLEAKQAGVSIVEVPAATIYLDGNASTHFRPIVDSARVYAPLLCFILSSFGAFVVDFLVLLVMMAITSQLLLSVVVARLVSASFNYAINRAFVFSHGRGTSLRTSAPRYVVLVAAILAANYALMHLLVHDRGLPLVVGKVITEGVLFIVSYHAQQRWIFRRADAPQPARYSAHGSPH